MLGSKSNWIQDIDGDWVVKHHVIHSLIVGILCHLIILAFLKLLFSETLTGFYALLVGYAYLCFKSVHFILNGTKVFRFNDFGIIYFSDRVFGRKKEHSVSWKQIVSVKFQPNPGPNSTSQMISPIDFILEKGISACKPAYGSIVTKETSTVLRFRVPVHNHRRIYELLDLLEVYLPVPGNRKWKKKEQ